MRREPTANRRSSTVELPSDSGAAMDCRMLHNMGSESVGSGVLRYCLVRADSLRMSWGMVDAVSWGMVDLRYSGCVRPIFGRFSAELWAELQAELRALPNHFAWGAHRTGRPDWPDHE